MSAVGVRRAKAALSSGCKSHPAIAPAGSNRSSYGGDEIAEAFGMRVTIYGDSASVQAVTRVNAEQALYGAFVVKHLFHSILHFLQSSFFVRLGIPFLRPDPHVLRPTRTGAVKVGRRSALAARSVVSRPRLDRPEHGGTLVVVGTTIRGELAIGRGSSRHNLVFGRSVAT
jgi:hypothetical protein